MAIKHIVLFKFKPNTKQENIQACLDKLNTLAYELPQIKKYQSFQYDSQEGLNQGFTHGFTMEFVSVKDRDDYLVHPEHEKVKAFIMPFLDTDGTNLTGVMAFDYNSDDCFHDYCAVHKDNET